MAETISLPEAMRSLHRSVERMILGGVKIKEAVQLFRVDYARAALAKHNGHRGRAAVEFGIHRNTLRRYLATK